MTLQIITADCLSSSKHGFFTRHGGISSGIFKGLNCGAGSSDQSDAVIKNKSLVCDAMGVSSDKLMTVHQIHSAEVIISSDQVIGTNPKADAIVSKYKRYSHWNTHGRLRANPFLRSGCWDCWCGSLRVAGCPKRHCPKHSQRNG
jgi:copper oxidase (laccase) domain-containing protein